MMKSINIELGFNPKPSTVMHIDLNSCFATIEQQANPTLRGRPVAVAAYTTPSGCILAASTEAKRLGVTTGLRVKEGKLLCPHLVVLAPDPWKYRNVHLSLKQLVSEYTSDVTPQSIDEFVLNLEGYPAYAKGMREVAREIKQRIKTEIGEWLTVSIGIAPNRFLAKTAANLHKPDGLDEINIHNVDEVYRRLVLQDLTGIAGQNAARLQQAGMYTVTDMYQASVKQLKSAFRSVVSYYWYARLRGWEIDDVSFGRKSYGNSYALPQPLKTEAELAPLIAKLTQKMAFRLRKSGWLAQGVHLALVYRDRSFWHQSQKTREVIFESRDIYHRLIHLFHHCPYQKPVAQIAVSVFNLIPTSTLQLDLFGEVDDKERLSRALDDINERWGPYVITPARMLGTGDQVPDRIAFGGMKELEEFTLRG